jgi:hypothetical protein
MPVFSPRLKLMNCCGGSGLLVNNIQDSVDARQSTAFSVLAVGFGVKAQQRTKEPHAQLPSQAATPF